MPLDTKCSGRNVMYINRTIIELRCGWPCMWQSTPRTADVTVTKIAGYVRACILTNRWFFSYFWHSYLLRYGHFVEYMNMHAMNMQLTVVVGRIGLCTHGVTTQVMLGVSLRARRDTTQVMLGVSLRARWDTTLVYIIPVCIVLYQCRHVSVDHQCNTSMFLTLICCRNSP